MFMYVACFFLSHFARENEPATCRFKSCKANNIYFAFTGPLGWEAVCKQLILY